MKEEVEGRDYCVRFVPLPIAIHGVTAKDEDDFFNIYINANQSPEVQHEAIEHELTHIRRGDFEKYDLPLGAVEDL